jgi:hypothetical protein
LFPGFFINISFPDRRCKLKLTGLFPSLILCVDNSCFTAARYNDGRGYDMGKIAAVLSTIFAFLIKASLPAFAQSASRDLGGYNNYYHFPDEKSAVTDKNKACKKYK